LGDPTTKESISLLSDEDRAAVERLISACLLPNYVDEVLVKALRQVLRGLIPVEIYRDEVETALFVEGAAATIDQLKQRFDEFLSQKCKGQDISKVRIVLK
jgi:hypothetical protein